MIETPQRPFWQRRFKLCLGIIVLAGLLLRLGVGFELYARHAAVTRPGEQTDMATYRDYAQELLDGEYDWSRGFYYQPFYYSVFLPVAYLAGGRGGAGVVFLQALLGAAAVGLTGLAFASLFGRGPGLLGATLLALSRMHVFYTPYLLIAVLQSFWMALFLYLAILAYTRRCWWLWALTGLTLAAGTLTRGNLLLFLPLLLALIAWRSRRQWRRAVALSALVVACFYLPQLPFALVNYRVHGEWTGPSSAGGAVLALGNTPESPPGGREPWTGPGPMEYPESSRAWVASENADGPSVAAHTWRWMQRHPLAYAELKFRMVLLFWNRMEVPNNVAERWVDPRTGEWTRVPSTLLRLPLLLPFWIVGPLGLLGVFWAFYRHRRRPAVWFAGLLVPAYCTSIVLFYVLARFRVPLLPLLCGFGGFGAIAWYRQCRPLMRGEAASRPRRAIAVIALLALAMTIIGYGYDAYRYAYEAAALRLARPDGTQIEYVDHWTIKDHGPWSFGGWQQTERQVTGRVTKTFVLPPGTASAAPRLRLPLSPGSGRALVMVHGTAGTRRVPVAWEGAVLTDTATWPTIALEPGELQGKDNARSITLSLREPSPGADFWFDAQRWYDRTTIDGGRLPPGELVVELVLPKRENPDGR